MKLINKGKTKDVFELENGNYLLKFKDDVTGADGKFDPGANEIALSIDGVGKEWLRLTVFFLKVIEKAGIPTHFVNADIEAGTMEVLRAEMFGNGLEFICRFKSTGSFMRRYGMYAKEGQDLDGIVEVTLKDDGRGDPVISADIAEALGITDRDTYDRLKKMTRDVAVIIKDELAKAGIALYDIKVEFGKRGDGIILIDEVSGSSMRVYKDGRQLEPFEIAKELLG